jgi:Iap family predicted aminopeptidase
MPANPETPTPKPAKPASFSVSRVLADTQAIEDLGRRVAGGSQEKAAADYVAARLRSMGYKVTIQKFNVPGGVSRNVTAHVAGDDPRVLVLGGHLDTRPTTPGANDNALGCAMVLEMARIFSTEKPPVSLELTMFGAEEYNDGTPRDHHRGSRYHVAHMTKAQRARTIGMISIDVVGYGNRLYTRTMKLGVKLSYSKDPGPTGWSDHEPYEKAGIPAVWLERLQDPQYHKPGDTTAHLQSSAVKATGRLVLDAIRNLDAAEATAIRGGAGDTSGE